jgi:hypothetical protein
MDSSTSSAHDFDAVIQTSLAETAYRRAGAGPPVLLLANAAASAAWLPRLVDPLAREFRVYLPVAVPSADGVRCVAGGPLIDPVAWLRDVVDGLGLVRPAIVSDADFAATAFGFAVADPDRVGRLAVVAGHNGQTFHTATLHTAGFAALQLPVAAATAGAAEALLAFLRREPGEPREAGEPRESPEPRDPRDPRDASVDIVQASC